MNKQATKSWTKHSWYQVMIAFVQTHCWQRNIIANSKVHGANMGPTWVLSAPDGPHVGPMNRAVRGGSRPHCLLTITCLIAVNRHIGCRIRYVVTTGGWVSIEVAGGLVTIRCQGICNHRVNPVRSMSYQYIDAASACNTENQELLWWQFWQHVWHWELSLRQSMVPTMTATVRFQCIHNYKTIFCSVDKIRLTFYSRVQLTQHIPSKIMVNTKLGLV